MSTACACLVKRADGLHLNPECSGYEFRRTKSWSNVFTEGAQYYTVGPIVDGRLRVTDASGERWINPDPIRESVRTTEDE